MSVCELNFQNDYYTPLSNNNSPTFYKLISNISSKHPDNRTSEEKDQLVNLLSQIQIVTESFKIAHNTKPYLLKYSDSLELCSFKRGTSLLFQGDQCDEAFVILKGSVNIFSLKTQEEIPKQQQEAYEPKYRLARTRVRSFTQDSSPLSIEFSDEFTNTSSPSRKGSHSSTLPDSCVSEDSIELGTPHSTSLSFDTIEGKAGFKVQCLIRIKSLVTLLRLKNMKACKTDYTDHLNLQDTVSDGYVINGKCLTQDYRSTVTFIAEEDVLCLRLKKDAFRSILKDETTKNEPKTIFLKKALYNVVRKLFSKSTALKIFKALLSTFLLYNTAKIRKYTNLKNIGSSLALALACYLVSVYNHGKTRITLTYTQNSHNQTIVSALKSLYNQHFSPSILCPGPLPQAVMNQILEYTPISFTRETLSLADGGQIVLDWALPLRKVEYDNTHLSGKYYPYEPSAETKILLVMHGLTGGSETTYIQTLVETASKDGYRVVVMNQRGVNQRLATPVTFHGGHIEDVAAGVSHIIRKFPNAPIVAVGTSFGANQLMRYLGELKEKTNIIGAAILAAPFEVNEVVDSIEGTLYEGAFIKSYLLSNFLPNLDMLQSLKDTHQINFEEILKVKSLRDFHKQFTVKLFGHKDVKEYFDTMKIQDSHIANIKVPMMILHAKDDPIAVHKSVPVKKLAENPNIIVAETSHGGHLCWFTGLKPKRWYDKPTMEFLNRIVALKADNM